MAAVAMYWVFVSPSIVQDTLWQRDRCGLPGFRNGCLQTQASRYVIYLVSFTEGGLQPNLSHCAGGTLSRTRMVLL